MALLEKFRSTLHQLLLLPQWRLARAIAVYAPRARTSNIIFVTADSHHLIGSRGDAAMLEGALHQMRKSNAATEIHLACASAQAQAIAESLHTRSLKVWGGLWMPWVFARSLRQLRPHAGFFMGADIMDGHYSPVTSLRMLIAADLLACHGASSRFLGFSLNAEVAPLVKLAFRWLDPRVEVNLRDPVSLRRHQAIAGDTGRLVADTAFLLAPAPPQPPAAAAMHWVAAEQAAGRRVLGLNYHPMLFQKNLAQKSTLQLSAAMVAAMQAVADQHPVSWLLVPHDNRVEAGDMSTLAALEAQLPDGLRRHSYRIDAPPSAGELKSIAGTLDGVITGRMHLAIAALGQTTPVLTLAYQGKFEGLVQHFELPDWVVLQPLDATDPALLTQRMLRFVDALPVLRQQIARQLPSVLAATEAPFRKFA